MIGRDDREVQDHEAGFSSAEQEVLKVWLELPIRDGAKENRQAEIGKDAARCDDPDLHLRRLFVSPK